MTAPRKAPYLCCRARKELAEQLAIAARLYAEAATLLAQSQDRQKIEELHHRALEAQQRSEAAHAAFVEHLQSHGC